MGLDWMLQRKIKTGHEEEAARLMGLKDGGEAERDRLDELSVNPFDVLGCPRVGIDVEATEYLRSLYQAHPDRFFRVIVKEPEGTEERRSLLWSEVLEDNHGRHVPDLAKHPDGIGSVVGMAAPECSFRGKMVAYMDIISEDLRSQAFQDMGPAQMLEYADDLERQARQSIEQAANPADKPVMAAALEGQFPAELDDPAIEEYVLVHDACRWLRFWAGKGFSMWAWY